MLLILYKFRLSLRAKLIGGFYIAEEKKERYRTKVDSTKWTVPEPKHKVSHVPEFYKNEDGHLCKTCKYRATEYERKVQDFGCAYILIKNHSRGCKTSYCTVYEEGPCYERYSWHRKGAFEL